MTKHTDEFDALDKVMTDINEFFRGDVLDQEKMDMLNVLRNFCAEIAEYDPRIKYSAYPFSNESRNATVIIDFPKVLFCNDRRVISRLSAAIAKADDLCVSTLDGHMRFSLGIKDMWKEFHYDEP